MPSHQLSKINNQDTFEDAICDLFNALKNTNTFKRFGRNGHNQKGIDIFSPEKDFAIQCKKKDTSRKSILLKKELLNDIKSDVERVLKSKLKIKISQLYFVSTFNNHPDIDEYCEELKNDLKLDFEIIYWGWDTLEGHFLDKKDILSKYWSEFIIPSNDKEVLFKRDLDLRKKIQIDFADWLNYAPKNWKRNAKMLLRAFDENQYPSSNNPDEFGNYSWFRAEFKSLYFRGIEFVTSIKEIKIFDDGSWGFAEIEPSKDLINLKVVEIIKVAEVSQLNFSDIVDYDTRGDEHYTCSHFFCKFRHNGSPFENVYYYNLEKPYEIFEF